MATLRNPVAYRTNRANMRIEIKGAPSQTRDPDAMLHPDVKTVEFRDGVYSTNDPEIVEALDARTDVWHADDPQSELRARFGPEEYERLRRQFAVAQDEEPIPTQ